MVKTINIFLYINHSSIIEIPSRIGSYEKNIEILPDQDIHKLIAQKKPDRPWYLSGLTHVIAATFGAATALLVMKSKEEHEIPNAPCMEMIAACTNDLLSQANISSLSHKYNSPEPPKLYSNPLPYLPALGKSDYNIEEIEENAAEAVRTPDKIQEICAQFLDH